MKKDSIISVFFDKMKDDKKFEMTVYAILVAIIVILYLFSARSKDKNTVDTEKDNVQNTQTEQETEKRLENTLSQIRGAGVVSVMITYDTSTEIVPAMSSSKQESFSETGGGKTNTENESNSLATVTKQGEQNPVVLTEIQPKVRGVIVIAEGAADISVKVALLQATATVLGIDENLIEVFEMKAE